MQFDIEYFIFEQEIEGILTPKIDELIDLQNSQIDEFSYEEFWFNGSVLFLN